MQPASASWRLGRLRVHVANGQAAIEPTYVIDLGLRQSKVVIEGLNVSEGDLGPGTDVLIGMDVIALGDFTVQNHEGKTHFAFCIPPFENKYDMVEKGRIINERAAKVLTKRHP